MVHDPNDQPKPHQNAAEGPESAEFLRHGRSPALHKAHPADMLRVFLADNPGIDVDAWLEWCVAGVPLCTPPETIEPQEQPRPWVPEIRDAGEAGRHFAANLAMARRGSITRAAAGLKTSRRALRETLKRAGTYQPPPAHKTQDEQPEGGAA